MNEISMQSWQLFLIGGFIGILLLISIAVIWRRESEKQFYEGRVRAMRKRLVSAAIHTGDKGWAGQTSATTPVGVYFDLHGCILAYTELEGFPLTIGSPQTPDKIFGGIPIRAMDAAIDTKDTVHVVALSIGGHVASNKIIGLGSDHPYWGNWVKVNQPMPVALFASDFTGVEVHMNIDRHDVPKASISVSAGPVQELILTPVENPNE
jgi:hypothetical protein